MQSLVGLRGPPKHDDDGQMIAHQVSGHLSNEANEVNGILFTQDATCHAN